MIDYLNFEKYITSISNELDDDLENIYLEALSNHVPVLRRSSIDILIFYLKMIKPLNVLELGTAVGFSGSLILRNSDSYLTTIERNDLRYAKAKENFAKLNLTNRINLIHGDAICEVKNLNSKFDFIFLDSAKGSYLELLPDLLKALNKEGILITDNILQEGNLLKPRSVITQRDRTTYDRMNEYVYKLFHTDGLATIVIPIGDGMSISYWEN